MENSYAQMFSMTLGLELTMIKSVKDLIVRFKWACNGLRYSNKEKKQK